MPSLQRPTSLAASGTRCAAPAEAAATPLCPPTRSHAQAQALDALDEASKKPMSAGGKIDLVLHKIRLGFFHMDLSLVKQTIDKAAECASAAPPACPALALTRWICARVRQDGGERRRLGPPQPPEGVRGGVPVADARH